MLVPQLGNLINRNILLVLDASMIRGKLPDDRGKGEGQEKHEYRRENALSKWVASILLSESKPGIEPNSSEHLVAAEGLEPSTYGL